MGHHTRSLNLDGHTVGQAIEGSTLVPPAANGPGTGHETTPNKLRCADNGGPHPTDKPSGSTRSNSSGSGIGRKVAGCRYRGLPVGCKLLVSSLYVARQGGPGISCSRLQQLISLFAVAAAGPFDLMESKY